MGTFKPWIPLVVDTPPSEDHDFQFPTDLKRVASSTTYKVLVGGIFERPLTKKQLRARAEKELTQQDYSKGVYGKRVTDPILGHYFHLPKRDTHLHDFTLDTSFPYVCFFLNKEVGCYVVFKLQIPVYQHLITPPPDESTVPKTTKDIVIGSKKNQASQKLKKIPSIDL